MGTDLTSGAIESDTLAQVIEEDQRVTLTQELRVNDFVPGEVLTPDNNQPTELLPIGTRVCSWLVRFDPVTAGQDVTITIDFGDTILGLAYTSDRLADTNELALDGVAYEAGADLGPSDRVTVNGTTITLQLHVENMDQVRVITACP